MLDPFLCFFWLIDYLGDVVSQSDGQEFLFVDESFSQDIKGFTDITWHCRWFVKRIKIHDQASKRRVHPEER